MGLSPQLLQKVLSPEEARAMLFGVTKDRKEMLLGSSFPLSGYSSFFK